MDRLSLKITLILVVLAQNAVSMLAQKLHRYHCFDGQITFFSSAPLEDIKAVNQKVKSAIDTEKNTLAFVVPMTAFTFQKALMQEHFNEKYVESDRFPQATFSGKITSDFNAQLHLKQDVMVTGDLTIHGVTQTITVKGLLTPGADNILAHAVFNVKPADYAIQIPKLLVKNIAESVEITVDLTYRPASLN